MGKPNANRGKEWSGTEIMDLQNCIKIGMPETEIAQFLSRTLPEVRKKASELIGFSIRRPKD